MRDAGRARGNLAKVSLNLSRLSFRLHVSFKVPPT
jgi:hypothetical protein